MVLRVEYEQFADEVTARLDGQIVYIAQVTGGSFVSAADTANGFIIEAFSDREPEQVLRELGEHGLRTAKGSWKSEDTEPCAIEPDRLYIGAVAYRSSEAKPGLWIEAFANQPTPAEVLKRMYDEMVSTGEIGNVSFEEMMRYATPNVVVVGPDQLRYFLQGT